MLRQQRLTTLLQRHLEHRLLRQESKQPDYNLWETKIVEVYRVEVTLVDGDPLSIQLCHEHVRIKLEVHLLIHVRLEAIRYSFFLAASTLRLHLFVISSCVHLISAKLARPHLMIQHLFHHGLDFVADRVLFNHLTKLLGFLYIVLDLVALQFKHVVFTDTVPLLLEMLMDDAQVGHDKIDADFTVIAHLHELEDVLVAN